MPLEYGYRQHICLQSAPCIGNYSYIGGISDLQTGKPSSVIYPEKGLLVLQWMAEYVITWCCKCN